MPIYAFIFFLLQTNSSYHIKLSYSLFISKDHNNCALLIIIPTNYIYLNKNTKNSWGGGNIPVCTKCSALGKAVVVLWLTEFGKYYMLYTSYWWISMLVSLLKSLESAALKHLFNCAHSTSFKFIWPQNTFH